MNKNDFQMNGKWILNGCLLLFMMSACMQKPQPDQQPGGEAIPVSLLSLQESSMQAPIRASGILTTDDETVLSFKTGGVVQSLLVQEGDRIQVGQVLAKVEPAEIDAGLQQAILAQEKAQRDYNRALTLYRDSVATREQLENARTARDMAEQQLKAVRFNSGHAQIRSPLSGYVLKRFVNVGQVVGPGTPVLMVNGAEAADWFVQVGLSDRQWSSVRVGDSARVTSDIWKNVEVDASVYRKSEGLDASSGMFSVLLKLSSKPELPVAAGALAQVTIRTSKNQKGWSIPYDALLEGDREEGYVFVSNDRKTVQKVKVQIRDIQQDRVWVDSGLEHMKYLVISGSAYLDDGSPIESINR